MFERPDADYLQDLLAGYVLGTLDRVERHYLEEQMARDPKLQRVLYQLEHAIETVERPRRKHVSPAALPTTVRPTFHIQPRKHRWIKRMIVMSAMVALGTTVSVGLYFLHQRYDLPQVVGDWFSSDAEVDSTPTAWQGFQFLLEDHSRVQRVVQAAPVVAQISLNEWDAISAALEQGFVETEGIRTLNGENILLLRGDRYEQPHFHGLRLIYRLGIEDPATEGTVMIVYQLQSAGDQELWLPGSVFIEADSGTNVLVWRSEETIYAISAQLPIETLRSYANGLAPL